MLYRPYARVLFMTCSASSRVGVNTSARSVPGGPDSNRCKMGSMKAAVFPVPVCADPIRSRPSSAMGIASCWTGVGSI